jgi:replicative DNA helicase
VIISDHVSNIGLKEQDGTDIPDYINSIVRSNSVSADKIELYFKECFKYKIARKAVKACRETELEINKNLNNPVSSIISIVEKGMAKVGTIEIDDEYKPVDIYDGLAEYLENIGESKVAEGVMTPFKTWNRWWGGLTKGDLTVIAAPPKTGKSTILNWIADIPFLNINKGKVIKVLFLDTELETERVRTRKAAALSQINENHFKTGEWMKSSEMSEKVQAQFEKFQKRANGCFKHIYVKNVPIEKICSIVKRWRLTDTDPTDECIVVYDYLKITGESVTDSNKEYQVMGDKCDTLKHLMSDISAAGVCAIQTNNLKDIAMSQRIKWFASNLFLFTKKTPEELALHGEKFGTHMLIPVELRNQAADWEEEQYIKEQKDNGIVWTKNWLNIEVRNFAMKEVGTGAEVMAEVKKQLDIEEPENDTPPFRKKKIKVEEEELI